MNLFNGKQICSNCGRKYEWNGYKLKAGESIFGSYAIQHQISDIIPQTGGKYIVITYCPICGHKDNTEYNSSKNKRNF